MSLVDRLPQKFQMQVSAPGSVVAQVKPDAPIWMLISLHPSHTLWQAGGICFCSVCCLLSSGWSKNSNLHMNCGSKFALRKGLDASRPTRLRIPSGSQGRLRRLSKGELPWSFDAWPNGAKKDEKFPPVRVYPNKKGWNKEAPPVPAVTPPQAFGVSSNSSFAVADVVAGSTVCQILRVPKRPFFWLEDDVAGSEGAVIDPSQARPKKRIRGKQPLAIEDAKV